MDLKPFELHYNYVKVYLKKNIKNQQDQEDIFQEILIYLWNKPETVIQYHKTYLYTLAKWFITKYKPENTKCIDDYSNIKCAGLTVAFNSEIGWNLYEIDDNVYKRLRTIPKKYLDPLLLKILDKKSIKEISSELSVNENTVKTNIKRAKEYLAFK